MTKARSRGSRPSEPRPLIVGVGASAGGVEAFHEFLAALGPSEVVALVFVQHLDPASRLDIEVVQQGTTLPVVEVKGRKKLKPGTVYLAAPQHFLEIANGAIRSVRSTGEQNPATVVDHFFQSLAEDQGGYAVAIVLSGTGTDGTVGLKAVGDAGGLTFAQAPETARFDSMPRSAAITGAADHVCSPAEIAAELLRYAEHVGEYGGEHDVARVDKQIGEAIPKICRHLASLSGHNFQHYKITTLTRRVRRRMQILTIGTAVEYLEYLERTEEEARALFRELLIGVTAFFRDPEAFDAIDSSVLPSIFENRGPDDIVRIWVAGCSTGEEAYSLAMMCHEYVERRSLTTAFQIFATDIDERALQVARTASYPSGVVDQVSAERLKRYFVKRGKRYQVVKEIKDRILFSKHNVISDPPFSRQDLISCRNLLIYLGSHLQEKLIPVFHYALRANGFLFLGPSETISSHGELFRPLDTKHRISQRRTVSNQSLGIWGGRSEEAKSMPARESEPDAVVDLNSLRQRILLDEFAPKAVVVDQTGQILNASDGIGKYLGVSGGDFQNNIVKMALPGLRIALRASINQAKKLRRKVTHENLSIRDNDRVQRVMLTVQPMPQLGEKNELLLVVFHDVGEPIRREEDLVSADVPATGDQQADAIIAQLERELESTRNDLERTLQDMEAANEELKSSNEELLSINEELQSANEELETSKDEIRHSRDAVSRANSDLENLLRSTKIATVFLDHQLQIRRFTPAIRELYNLITADVGRPLAAFVPMVQEMPPLPDPAKMQDDQVVEDTVIAQSGKAYIRRVQLYRSPDGQPDGVVVTFSDVTELRTSEEKFRGTFENAAVGIAHVGIDGAWLQVNDRLCEIVGYSREVLLKKRFQDITFAEDLTQDLDEVNKLLNGSTQSYSLEKRYIRADDVLVWVRLTVSLRRSASGVPDHFIAVVEDISKAKQFEKELAERESHLRRVIDNNAAFIGVMDTQGVLLEANSPALAAGGVKRADVIGKPFWDAYWWNFDPAIQEDLKAMVKRAAAGESIRKDMTYRVAGDQRRTLDFMLGPIRNDAGEVVYLVPSAVDIEDRKRFEQQQREIAFRLEMALRAGRMAAWQWTPTESHWTREVYELLGVSPDQPASPDLFFSRVHPDDVEQLTAMWSAAIDGVAEYDCEFRVICPDGEVRWLVGMGEVVRDKSGKVTGMYGLNWDNTREHLQADALKESERRANQASASKSEFLANMSHEIRTPMTAILGYADLLREYVVTEEARHYLDTIRHNGDYLVEIINDILDLSKIEAGKLEIENELFEPVRIVDDVCSIMVVRAHESGLKLSVEYMGLIPREIRSDGKRLKQILINLVGNAVKFTRQGHVTLRVRFDADVNKLCFDVIDTGIGITASQMESLYKPFSQGDASVTRDFGGTGLGLAISQRLAQRLGGEISAISEPGRGSTFTATIDVGGVDTLELVRIDAGQAAQRLNEQAASSEEMVALDCHVLVIDDRRDIRFLSKHLITSAGGRVSEACDGMEGVAVMRDSLERGERFDLVLLDMQMPNLDGYQTAGQLRQLGYAGPIIALTANAMEGDMHDCIAAGCTDYLSKPIDKALFLEKLYRHLDRDC